MIIDQIKNKNAIILVNKIDLIEHLSYELEELEKTGKPIVKISAKERTGMEEFYQTIVEMFHLEAFDTDSETVITNVRHKNQIHKALLAAEKAEKAIWNNLPIDVIAIEMKEILEALGEISGDNVSEDIINEIFRKFCLGK